MDDIDRARRTTDRMLAVQLANQVGKGRYQGESAPVRRVRRPHPRGTPPPHTGVRLCVPCKTRLERLGR